MIRRIAKIGATGVIIVFSCYAGLLVIAGVVLGPLKLYSGSTLKQTSTWLSHQCYHPNVIVSALYLSTKEPAVFAASRLRSQKPALEKSNRYGPNTGMRFPGGSCHREVPLVYEVTTGQFHGDLVPPCGLYLRELRRCFIEQVNRTIISSDQYPHKRICRTFDPDNCRIPNYSRRF